MLVRRIVSMLALGAGLFVSAPASAQFFMKSPTLASGRVTGEEPGIVGQPLPGASPEERRAALVWSLRAALNVAALQCQFDPTLLTLGNYNAVLKDHEVELRNSYDTLEKYFVRSAKAKKAGQTELDRFGTRTYSSFSTVSGQLTFCQTAASIGHEALFAKRGDFGDLAFDRIRELRASLTGWGDQYRINPSFAMPSIGRTPAFGNKKCWKKDTYQPSKCGPLG
jgi:hypothetical protein